MTACIPASVTVVTQVCTLSCGHSTVLCSRHSTVPNLHPALLPNTYCQHAWQASLQHARGCSISLRQQAKLGRGMATATRAPPAKRRETAQKADSKPWRPWDLVQLKEVQNFLKLRSAKQINDQLSMDIGADYCLRTREAQPIASFFYDVRGTQHHACIQRSELRPWRVHAADQQGEQVLWDGGRGPEQAHHAAEALQLLARPLRPDHPPQSRLHV